MNSNQQHATVTPEGHALMNWAFNPLFKNRVRDGVHSIPKQWMGTNILAGSAIMEYDFSHYLDFFWNDPNGPLNSQGTTTYDRQTEYPDDKLLRHQVSVKTCGGCHGGDTRVLFTQVHPRAYGSSADYWSNNFSTVSGNLDDRFYANTGADPYGSTNRYVNSHASSLIGFDITVPVVSPFLTGRNYINGSYDDDKVDFDEDLTDASTDGLFYVWDPTNNGDGKNDPSTYQFQTWPAPVSMYGYNDLRRRKEDLCVFLTEACVTPPLGSSSSVLGSTASTSAVFQLVKIISFRPFPAGAH